MKLSNNTKVLILFLGDIAALYLSLFIAIVLRYDGNFYEPFSQHLAPFSSIFFIWIVTFYIAGLYDLRRLRNNLEFLKTLSTSLFINALLAIALFYLIPWFGIAPRRNLFIFLVVFAAIEAMWRRTFNLRASFREGLNKVLLLGESKSAAEIHEAMKHNPQLGYEVKVWLKKGLGDPEIRNLRSLAKQNDISLIVIPPDTTKDFKLTKAFYNLLASGIEIQDIPKFYEAVFRKIPVGELEEGWFLENQIGQKKFYDDFKRAIELLAGLVLGALLLPLEILIAVIVKLTSPGPVIYKQMRVGQYGKTFTLYKFRTMRVDAEKDGPQWGTYNDARSTWFGKILRMSHLDELPQFINLFKGDISFVGPRPERPEFVKTLAEKIPYYEIRLLVKPGVTGWAQINYRSDITTEDVAEKLRHDVYYLKNRSLILDLAIILKTLKTIFITPK